MPKDIFGHAVAYYAASSDQRSSWRRRSFGFSRPCKTLSLGRFGPVKPTLLHIQLSFKMLRSDFDTICVVAFTDQN
eukprot:scaffold110910_cov27-Prasinocladus_malaysianus.AAC.1